MISAVAFDMDGVIVDSEAQWRAAEEEFFKNTIASWSESDHDRILGMGVADVHAYLKKNFSFKMTLDDYLKRQEATAQKVYGERVVLEPGILEFMRELRDALFQPRWPRRRRGAGSISCSSASS